MKGTCLTFFEFEKFKFKNIQSLFLRCYFYNFYLFAFFLFFFFLFIFPLFFSSFPPPPPPHLLFPLLIFFLFLNFFFIFQKGDQILCVCLRAISIISEKYEKENSTSATFPSFQKTWNVLKKTFHSSPSFHYHDDLHEYSNHLNSCSSFTELQSYLWAFLFVSEPFQFFLSDVLDTTTTIPTLISHNTSSSFSLSKLNKQFTTQQKCQANFQEILAVHPFFSIPQLDPLTAFLSEVYFHLKSTKEIYRRIKPLLSEIWFSSPQQPQQLPQPSQPPLQQQLSPPPQQLQHCASLHSPPQQLQLPQLYSPPLPPQSPPLPPLPSPHLFQVFIFYSHPHHPILLLFILLFLNIFPQKEKFHFFSFIFFNDPFFFLSSFF